jgi:hypothetical protein
MDSPNSFEPDFGELDTMVGIGRGVLLLVYCALLLWGSYEAGAWVWVKLWEYFHA